MAGAAVFIGTTVEPVRVRQIRIDTAIRAPALSVNFGVDPPAQLEQYRHFVSESNGVIARFTGGEERYRCQISADIKDGLSWRLGMFVAHALRHHAKLRERQDRAPDGILPQDELEGAEELIWATGVVDADLNVLRVTDIPLKLRRSEALFQAAVLRGLPILLLAPEEGRDSVVDQAFADVVQRFNAHVVYLRKVSFSDVPWATPAESPADPVQTGLLGTTGEGADPNKDAVTRSTAARAGPGIFARWVFAACLIAAVATGGLLWATKWRLETFYCANFSESWGVPHCIGRLDKSTFKRREVSYRFSVRAGRVVELASVNSHDELRVHPLGSMDANWVQDVAQRTYAYDAEGRLLTVNMADDDGDQLVAMTYEFEPGAQPKEAAVRLTQGIGKTDMFSPHGARIARSNSYNHGSLYDPLAVNFIEGLGDHVRSGIGQHRLDFDSAGRILKREFRTLSGDEPVADADGVASMSYAYSPDGLPNEIRNLGLDDSRNQGAGEVTILGAHYTAKGDIAGIEWRSTNGHLTSGPTGSARQDFIRDAAGNTTELRFFDENGGAVFDRGSGFAGVKMVYDPRGNLVERIFLGTDGKPAPLNFACRNVSEKIEYDSYGLESSLSVFDANGKPFTCLQGDMAGAAILRYARNEGEGEGSEAYFDGEGHAVLAGEVCVARLSYRAVVEEQDYEIKYQGVNGKPVETCNWGVAIVRFRTSDSGTNQEIRFYDASGAPAIGQEGYHGFDSKFDVLKNAQMLTLVGKDNGPIERLRGMRSIKINYNTNGQMSSIELLAQDGKPQPQGPARIEFKSNDRGYVVETAAFDAEGHKALAADTGIHKTSYEFNLAGKVISRVRTDDLGRLVGVVYRQEYDLLGRETERSCWDLRNGEQSEALCEKGAEVHRVHREFDERHNIVAETYFGTNGQEVTGARGYHGEKKEVNSLGQVVSKSYFDVRGNSVPDPTGCFVMKFEYDKRDNLSKSTCLTADRHTRTLGNANFAEVAYEWDARNKLKHEEYRGVDGLPTEVGGYASVDIDNDDYGRPAKERYFGADGRPIEGDGEAGLTFKYDEYGRMIEKVFLDQNGEMAYNPIVEAAIVRRRYNSDGRLLEFLFLDASGNPSDGKLGFYKEVFDYSADGICVSRRAIHRGEGVLGELKVKSQSECGRSTRWLGSRSVTDVAGF